jgi:hypothetical protein
MMNQELPTVAPVETSDYRYYSPECHKAPGSRFVAQLSKCDFYLWDIGSHLD